MAIAEHRSRTMPQQDIHSEALHLRTQEAAAIEVELPFHQGVHQMNYGHVTSLYLESSGGLQS